MKIRMELEMLFRRAYKVNPLDSDRELRELGYDELAATLRAEMREHLSAEAMLGRSVAARAWETGYDPPLGLSYE